MVFLYNPLLNMNTLSEFLGFNRQTNVYAIPIQQIIQDDQQHHFCYFQIRNQQSLITQLVLIGISVLICTLALKKYRDVWIMISNRNRNANITFIAIIIWWLSYLTKNLYGIIIYIVYSGRDDNVTEQLSIFSKFYFALDWGNAFVMQSILIFVPYHWMKQLSEAMAAVCGSGDIGGQSDSGVYQNTFPNGYQGIQPKIYPILRIYLLIRALSVIPVVLFLILTDFNTISMICKILLSILLFDCLIIIIVLSLGLYSLKTNELLKMQLDAGQSKRLFGQYFVIIVCTAIRFAYDSYVVVMGAVQKLTQDNCNLVALFSWITLAILILQSIFAHYLPILMVLRIYTVDQQPEQLTKSMIIAE